MTFARKFLAGLLFFSFFAGFCRAGIDSRYSSILDRNPFGLRTESTTPEVKPPKVLPHIKLAGVDSFRGGKRGWFCMTWAGPNRQPGYVQLKEGESAGPLTLLEIAEEGRARILVLGEELTVKFEASPLPPHIALKLPSRPN